jgi:hypothetical protein
MLVILTLEEILGGTHEIQTFQKFCASEAVEICCHVFICCQVQSTRMRFRCTSRTSLGQPPNWRSGRSYSCCKAIRWRLRWKSSSQFCLQPIPLNLSRWRISDSAALAYIPSRSLQILEIFLNPLPSSWYVPFHVLPNRSWGGVGVISCFTN